MHVKWVKIRENVGDFFYQREQATFCNNKMSVKRGLTVYEIIIFTPVPYLVNKYRLCFLASKQAIIAIIIIV